MNDMPRGYDAWKTTPPEAPEQVECPECEGACWQFTEEARAALIRDARTYTPEDLVKFIYTLEHEDCERCEGTGYVDPPTPEDIADARADEMLSDPDFNRQTGRYE